MSIIQPKDSLICTLPEKGFKVSIQGNKYTNGINLSLNSTHTN